MQISKSQARTGNHRPCRTPPPTHPSVRPPARPPTAAAAQLGHLPFQFQCQCQCHTGVESPSRRAVPLRRCLCLFIHVYSARARGCVLLPIARKYMTTNYYYYCTATLCMHVHARTDAHMPAVWTVCELPRSPGSIITHPHTYIHTAASRRYCCRCHCRRRGRRRRRSGSRHSYRKQ